MALLSSASFVGENRSWNCTPDPTCSRFLSFAPNICSSAPRSFYISFSRTLLTIKCKRPRLHPFSPSLSRHSSGCFFRCRAGNSGRPPSDPTSEQDELSIEGIFPTLSRLPDTVRIFMAVLFWMSLFFWASAWDGRNGGKRNKGNHFRR